MKKSQLKQLDLALNQTSKKLDGENGDLWHTTLHDKVLDEDVSDTNQTLEVITLFSTTSKPEPYYFTNTWILDRGSKKHIYNLPYCNNYTKTRNAALNSFI